MIARLLVLLAACLATQAGPAARARDPPAPPAAGPLDQLQKNADDFAKTFSEQLNSLVTSKNTQELNKALKDSADAILKQVSALSTSLQGALTDANGKAKEALEKARSELERTSQQLRAEHPEVEQQAAALRERLQAAVQTTLQHSQVLAKEVATNIEATNEKLAPKIKTAYDDFIKQAQDVQGKLHEAATKH